MGVFLLDSLRIRKTDTELNPDVCLSGPAGMNEYCRTSIGLCNSKRPVLLGPVWSCLADYVNTAEVEYRRS